MIHVNIKSFLKIFGINWRWLRCWHYLVIIILGDGNVGTSYPCRAQPRATPTIPPSPPTLSTLALALVTRGKSFQSEISSAFSFYARELNLVSICRQMNKLYSEIIKRRGKDGEKNEIFWVEITDTIKIFVLKFLAHLSFTIES